MLRGKLIAGTDEERIGAARTLSDLFDIDSDAGHGLDASETGLIHAIVRLDGRGIAAAKIAEFTNPLAQQALDGMFRPEPPEAMEDQPGDGTRTLKIREGDTGETIPIPLADHSNAPENFLASSDGGAGATSAQRARDTVRSITGAPGDERRERDTRDGANKVAKPKRSDAAYAPKPLPEPTKELLKKRLDGRDILEVFAPDPKNKWPGITPEMAKQGGEARVRRALERLLVFDEMTYSEKQKLNTELDQLKDAGAIGLDVINRAKAGLLEKTAGKSERYLARDELATRSRRYGVFSKAAAIGGTVATRVPALSLAAGTASIAANSAKEFAERELRKRERLEGKRSQTMQNELQQENRKLRAEEKERRALETENEHLKTRIDELNRKLKKSGAP